MVGGDRGVFSNEALSLHPAAAQTARLQDELMPRRTAAFRDLRTAPRDGTAIEIKHGPAQEVVRARWSGQGQAWVRVGDPLRRALHRVTGWRPVAR
jgi:hypothetical protein